MLLEASRGYGSAPTSPVNVNKARFASASLSHFLCPAGVLQKYDMVGLFLDALFIATKHLSHWLFQKADILFLRMMVWLPTGTAGIAEVGLNVNWLKP